MESEFGKCPVCSCTFMAKEKLHFCTECHTPHHHDCWDYNEGCAVFGCSCSPAPPPVPQPTDDQKPVSLALLSQGTQVQALQTQCLQPKTANHVLMKFFGKLMKLQYCTFLASSITCFITVILTILKSVFPLLATVSTFSYCTTAFFITVYIVLCAPAALVRMYFLAIGHQTPRISSTLAASYENLLTPPTQNSFIERISKSLSLCKYTSGVCVLVIMAYMLSTEGLSSVHVKILGAFVATFLTVLTIEAVNNSRKRLSHHFRHKLLTTYGHSELSALHEEVAKNRYMNWKKLS